MAVSVEDLEDLYDSYSDGEIIRLYSSENLTEVAKKVALNEIKLRRLTIQANENGDSESVEEESMPSDEMIVIANNLRFDEAIILSEAMIAEGVTSDTQGSNIHNAFFPSGFNHLVRVDKRHFEQALVIYEQFKNSQTVRDEVKAEEKINEEKAVKFSELTEEEQKIVRQVAVSTAMWVGGILVIAFLLVVNSKSIVQFVAPYMTSNIVHGFLLIVSFFLLKGSISASERGSVKAKNGTDITKEDRPYAFWFEVIGGYVASALCFIYGIQYFLRVSILPTSLTVYEEWIKLMFKVLFQSFK